MWLLAVFVLLPIIEIALFIQVGSAIGLWPTLALVILSAVLGVVVMRSQGRNAWLEAQRSLAEVRDPSRPLAHGAMIMTAGILLVMPGFLTDTIGLLLLIPFVRNAVIGYFGRRVRVTRAHSTSYGYRPPYADGVIEGDYVVEDEPPVKRGQMPPDLEPPEDQQPPRSGKSGWTQH
ncbi:FxsA family protein [Paracoccus sp. 11-3]|uniref:FxsA family protein n=1 Tax=Paracoccus amoyensis TaxID=2760093 RepID=A0A926JBW9_9RHOB|nr:FxsA family protein [Paracoccus amoyensis]MBC9246295.1 FxsA family protein [Paracoccus amoyensis]